MNYKIGYSFLLTIKDKRGVWAITEIDKKGNKYILTGISDKVEGLKYRADINIFDERIDDQPMPIFEPRGKIVETEDRIYIEPRRKRKQNLEKSL